VSETRQDPGAMRDIKESDWRIFRELHTVALERFCQRVLEEVERLNADSAKTNHQRYLAIYRYTRECDEDLAFAFNDKRRSTAVLQLARIQYHDLLTSEEFSRFSEETRAAVEVLLEIQRGESAWKKS
jgi:hypothetical protein